MSTNYLKNFAEGETIKASETNANNQFLLNKISDNASDIQLTVQTQISNVKSELATTKNALQTELETKLSKDDQATIVGWCIPDYSKGKDAPFPYTATADGVIYFNILQNNIGGSVYINDVFVAYYSDQSDGAARDNFTFMLSKGDKINCSIPVSNPRFFPMKGAE